MRKAGSEIHWWWWIPLAALAVIGLTSLFPIYSTVHVTVEMTRNMSRGKGLGQALASFAVDSKGVLPVKLSELEPYYLTNTPSSERFLYLAPKTRQRLEWVYFSLKPTKQTPNPIRLAAPIPWENPQRQLKRLVIYADTTAEFIPESDFARTLAEQVRDASAQNIDSYKEN